VAGFGAPNDSECVGLRYVHLPELGICVAEVIERCGMVPLTAVHL
jgi:hypothetical protein